MSRVHFIVFVAVAALLGACHSTRHAKSVEPSGFLAEYRDLLQPGGEGEALLRYRAPDVNWASYKKIFLAPFTIWVGPDTKLTKDQQKNLEVLVDNFYNLVYLKLSKDYEMVDKAGPHTMFIKAAITHGEASVVAATTVTKIIPQARMLNTLWTFATDKPAFSGEASIEVIVRDAETGKVLAAGADRRFGGTKLLDSEVINSWGDVKNSLDLWADASVWRLCVLRGEKNCVKPKA